MLLSHCHLSIGFVARINDGPLQQASGATSEASESTQGVQKASNNPPGIPWEVYIIVPLVIYVMVRLYCTSFHVGLLSNVDDAWDPWTQHTCLWMHSRHGRA